MISRIRMDAFGSTAEEVANILENHGQEIERLLGVPVSYGECVITRALVEPKDSQFAWEGRLNLHPAIGRASASGVIATGAAVVEIQTA